ncbi:MAG: hypothetical protein JNL11_01410 [Bdellovibrionaceae bacterium]|nr:hypothetical protein [Pseudobdellovibrionaceae bacterium]
MRGKHVFVYCGLLACLVSCVRPKYIDEVASSEKNVENNSSQTTSLGQQKVSCLNTFSTSQLCMRWSWEVQPTSKQVGSFVFKVYRLNQWDQTAVEVDLSAMPEVVLWMPSMGHGSTPTKIERLDVGTYRVGNVFFIMPGAWEIRFQVKDESKAIVDGVNIAISI